MTDILFPAGWQHYLLGGAWIGAGLALLFVLTGRTGSIRAAADAGGSTTWRPRPERLVYAVGLLLGAAIWWTWAGPKFSIATGLPWWQLLAGGFLVGLGARISLGGSLSLGPGGFASLRSLVVAAPVFLGTAVVVAKLTWWAWGR